MAKKFLSYGLTKGLSYREDWDKVIERALQSETLDRQAQQIREEKVRYQADKMEKAHVISERHLKEYEEFCGDLNRQIADFHIDNPGWETDLNLHMKHNQLTDQYLNNPILIADKKLELEWEKFRAASPNLLAREIEENIKAYDDYNEGLTNVPYTFYAPKPFDYLPHVQNAVKLISQNPEQFTDIIKDVVYGTRTVWRNERLRDIARGLIADNPDEYEREFKKIANLGFDKVYANEEDWITSVIESYLGPGGVKPSGRLLQGRTGAGDSAGTGIGSFYYNNVKKRTGSTNDPNIGYLIPTSVDTKKNRWLDSGQEGHIMFLSTVEGRTSAATPFGQAKSTEPSGELVENKLIFRTKPNQFMIERVSPEWKTAESGTPYARARMKMLPETFEDLRLADKLNSIGLPYNLIEEKVRVTQADKLMQSIAMLVDKQTVQEEESTGTQLAGIFAVEEPEKYWYFDAWIPLSNHSASITSYNNAHKNVPSKIGLEADYPEFFYPSESPQSESSEYLGEYVEQGGITYYWTGQGYEPIE